jgi:ABC-type antimicrobial peptide transport system permease subunit
MFHHILTIIYRNFKRFRSTFLINLIGLSTGLACAIVIYLWVADETRIDRFHEHGDRLFQVMTNQNRPDVIVTLGEGPGMLEDELPAAFPEIEYAVGSSGIGDFITLSTPNKNLQATGQFAGLHYFEIFSFPLLEGNPKDVLKDEKSIVLSQRMALALFDTDKDVVGKALEWKVPGYTEQVMVSGIFEDINPMSSLQFDFVLPYDVYEDFMRSMGSLSWGNHNAVTYLLLKEHTDVALLNDKIRGFVRKHDPTSNLTLFLRPFSDNYLYSKYENGKIAGGRIVYVRIFSAVAVVILIIACVNFMNLATARASRRVREVGIKKAMGAGRGSLALQYLAESVFMATLSTILAIVAVEFFLPHFNEITGKRLTIPMDPAFALVVTGITILAGVLAGSYPALYLSGFSPSKILKARVQLPGGESWARKGLVAFQFTLAIVFITAVWVTYRQMEFIRQKNLGFDRENVLSFRLEGKVASNLDVQSAGYQQSSSSHKFESLFESKEQTPRQVQFACSKSWRVGNNRV